MWRSLQVEDDGVTFKVDEGRGGYLGIPSYPHRIALDALQFDALLAARGDLGSLKPLGMDFSLTSMDEKKVIDGVRKLSPLAVKLHQAFPNNWTKANKLSYKQSGKFSSSAALGNGVELSVNRDIRVAADGFNVELVAEPHESRRGSSGASGAFRQRKVFRDQHMGATWTTGTQMVCLDRPADACLSAEASKTDGT
jgi:hypothetical protein